LSLVHNHENNKHTTNPQTSTNPQTQQTQQTHEKEGILTGTMNKSSPNFSLIAVVLLLVFPSSVNSFSSTATTTTTTTIDVSTKNKNVNFEDWISDARHEVSRTSLEVQGVIPSYVQGTLMRNGGAQWSSTNAKDQMTYSHIFDGLAKISSYEIAGSSTSSSEDTNNVHYQTRFIRSEWYKKIQASQTGIPPGISTGPVLDTVTSQPVVGNWRSFMGLINAIQFDNPCVNIWDYSRGDDKHNTGVATALTDAPPRAEISMNDLGTLSTSTQTPQTDNMKGYEMFCTTHPEYSKTETGSTYNAGIEIGLNGPRVIVTKEKGSSREVVGRSVPFDDIPYTHSFGVNGKHATVVLQPLRLNLNPKKMGEMGFMRAMDEIDYTRIIVFDLDSGEVVLDKQIDEKIFFYHTISAVEDLSNNDENTGQTVSIRLCAYKTPDILTGENHFMRLEKCLGEGGKENRNRISKGGTFCDITCNLKDGSVQVDWKEELKQGFELPVTRYSRSSGKDALTSRHPRYVYSYGAYANGSEEYDSWALFKFDMEKLCIDACYQQDSAYPSEPIFVANPDGSTEDDGVVLSQIYDGIRRETALLVLDAKTMEVQATVWTGQRSPMDFHGAWIPST
jgi:carotenoid cleavage dioxygenase-like enzyme